MPPKVSFVVPAYNAEKHLTLTIESILQQTYENFELIVIDDGSTDGTAAILDGFSKRDKRVVVLKNQKNLGIVGTLNRGLGQAAGEYIARIDADDIAPPMRLEHQVAFMDAHRDVVLSGTNYVSFASDGRTSPQYLSFESPECLRFIAMFRPPVAHPTVMIRKSALIEGRLSYSEDARYCEDFELWQRLLLRGKVAIVPKVSVLYRRHEQAISVSKQAEQTQEAREICRRALARYFGDEIAANTNFEQFLDLMFHVDPAVDVKISPVLAFAHRLAKIYAERNKLGVVERVRVYGWLGHMVLAGTGKALSFDVAEFLLRHPIWIPALALRFVRRWSERKARYPFVGDYIAGIPLKLTEALPQSAR